MYFSGKRFAYAGSSSLLMYLATVYHVMLLWHLCPTVTLAMLCQNV